MSQAQSNPSYIEIGLIGEYSLGGLCFFSALVIFSLIFYHKPNTKIESQLYWFFALILVIFSAIRPIGLSRDDLHYLEISKNICSIVECIQLIQGSRDWGWYLFVALLKSAMPAERAILVLSGICTFIQLLIIDRLCRHKLLALTLFIPLSYLYYDFTLLRAGLALTVFFMAFYFLVRSKQFLGSTLLLSNYFFHSQGIFSIGLILFNQISRYKYIGIIVITLLVIFIYLEWTPSFEQLLPLSKNESAPYWDQYRQGLFDNQINFPLAHLLIIGYVIFILLINDSTTEEKNRDQLAFASILLAIFLAWFFAPIHAIQTRLFDFYAAPLVFLAGNLRGPRITQGITLLIAILLYIRMEFLHNWIIG
ncbi:EpsG family protein [Polynucleobacter sp. HIN5]|uniref:EpsG family protein n=1 Tax=Polynucleobacter sp. HIN5 TaxID=3047864 RepID=UPI002574251F|nr:EpsG family protein [Polynucleobacter sp. HIN5]BEI32938.1 hypothetical protein PHIN5_03060 [Polynucleobacter sp. HIN5]